LPFTLAGVGIAALFEDLQRMVAHSKALNAANPMHLPYRLADMLGKIFTLLMTLRFVIIDTRLLIFALFIMYR